MDFTYVAIAADFTSESTDLKLNACCVSQKKYPGAPETGTDFGARDKTRSNGLLEDPVNAYEFDVFSTTNLSDGNWSSSVSICLTVFPILL